MTESADPDAHSKMRDSILLAAFWAKWGDEATCGWLRLGRQERSRYSRRPRASLKVDHSRAREPVYDFYEVYECGSDLLFKVRERPASPKTN